MFLLVFQGVMLVFLVPVVILSALENYQFRELSEGPHRHSCRALFLTTAYQNNVCLTFTIIPYSTYLFCNNIQAHSIW